MTLSLHYITLHCITFTLHLHYIYITFTLHLHYITLHYTTLHYITLHYITLHYIQTYLPDLPVCLPACICTYTYTRNVMKTRVQPQHYTKVHTYLT